MKIIPRTVTVLAAAALLAGGCAPIKNLYNSIFGSDESERSEAGAAMDAVLAGSAPNDAQSAAAEHILAQATAHVEIVPLPPVPDGCTQRNDGTSVISTAPPLPASYRERLGMEDAGAPSAEVRITYTSRTHGQDAAAYADGVIKERSCSAKVRAGTGFYTAACPGSGSHLVWVGEPGNLYMVEISGYYDRGVKALVEGYISAVVNGKRVFRDRNIGLLDHQS